MAELTRRRFLTLGAAAAAAAILPKPPAPAPAPECVIGQWADYHQQSDMALITEVEPATEFTVMPAIPNAAWEYLAAMQTFTDALTGASPHARMVARRHDCTLVGQCDNMPA